MAVNEKKMKMEENREENTGQKLMAVDEKKMKMEENRKKTQNKNSWLSMRKR